MVWVYALGTQKPAVSDGRRIGDRLGGDAVPGQHAKNGGARYDERGPSAWPGNLRRCAERTMSIVGLRANRSEPIKNSQSAAVVVEVKKKKALPMTKHAAAPKSTAGTHDLIAPVHGEMSRRQVIEGWIEKSHEAPLFVTRQRRDGQRRDSAIRYRRRPLTACLSV